MATKPISVGSLKEGSYVVLENTACVVTDTVTSKSGKHGHAKARLTAVGIIDGKKRIVVLPAHNNLETPIIEKKSAQVLSIKGDVANLMDAETYETFDLKIPEELKDKVVEGCSVLYWQVLGDKIMKQLKGGE